MLNFDMGFNHRAIGTFPGSPADRLGWCEIPQVGRPLGRSDPWKVGSLSAPTEYDRSRPGHGSERRSFPLPPGSAARLRSAP